MVSASRKAICYSASNREESKMDSIVMRAVGLTALVVAVAFLRCGGDDGGGGDAATDVASDVVAADVTPEVTPEVSADLPVDLAPDLPVEVVPEVAAEVGIEEMLFSEFQPWANPTQDFIDYNTDKLGHSDFMHDIFAMAVFEDRLYFGYGDANLNLGHDTPIELRYWDEPVPDGYKFDFIVDEEQVSRYRIDGDLFMIPGVDATEDGLMGNAYTKQAGGEWYKSRTLEGGWHVHDIVRIGETIYACGSGGTKDDYTNSTVNAFLWRSTDGGETFEVHVKSPHPAPPGDHRYTSLLAVGEQLYVFGYYSDGQFSYAIAYYLDGSELKLAEEILDFYVIDTVQLSQDVGLLAGVRIADPLKFGMNVVTSNGSQAAPAFEGYTYINSQTLGDGRAVILFLKGDQYPFPEAGSWLATVMITDGEAATTLATLSTPIVPSSVALWRGDLYMGISDGSVWRSEGTAP